jgi:hypothetical protein
MHRLSFVLTAMAAAVAAGGCSSLTLPSLSGAAPAPPAPAADAVQPTGPPNAFETAFMVPGTPTGIYAIVARGALNCWLGVAGPLRATHVFAAQAAPPNQGGAAEIVLHERDPSFRDQRGPRALRVSFEQVQGSVRVGLSNLRLGVALAEAMAGDAAAWAKGGGGCRAQEVRESGATAGTRPPPSFAGNRN